MNHSIGNSPATVKRMLLPTSLAAWRMSMTTTQEVRRRGRRPAPVGDIRRMGRFWWRKNAKGRWDRWRSGENFGTTVIGRKSSGSLPDRYPLNKQYAQEEEKS